MRMSGLLPILALVAVAGCTDITDLQPERDPLFAIEGATRTDVASTMAVTGANFDKGSWWGTGPGKARTWGVVTINAVDGSWEGNLTGVFIFDPAQSEINAQLFSRINLHGPEGQKLKAVCDETSAESEVLACTGEILSQRE